MIGQFFLFGGIRITNFKDPSPFNIKMCFEQLNNSPCNCKKHDSGWFLSVFFFWFSWIFEGGGGGGVTFRGHTKPGK
jgi:hypothetical protein